MSYPEDTPGTYPEDTHDDDVFHGDTRADARIETQRIDREQRRALHPNEPGSIDLDAEPAAGQMVREHPSVGTHRSSTRTAGEPRTAAHHDDEDAEIIERLREPDTRARLLLATAGIAAATFLLVLVGLILALTEGPEEPVLVDGVPCLVQEGEDGQALLYCQR